MINTFKTIGFSLILILFLNSCRQNDNISKNFEQNNTLRQEFLSGKSYDEVKLNFANLTTENKILIWQNKLDQVLQENLSQEQMSLILKIKQDLPNIKNNDYQTLLDNSIRLAKILPEKNFISIFEDLRDTKISKINIASSSQNLILDLENFKSNLNQSYPYHGKSKNVLPYCMYRWLSLDSGPCIETNGGCGWFFAQPCTH